MTQMIQITMGPMSYAKNLYEYKAFPTDLVLRLRQVQARLFKLTLCMIERQGPLVGYNLPEIMTWTSNYTNCFCGMKCPINVLTSAAVYWHLTENVHVIKHVLLVC